MQNQLVFGFRLGVLIWLLLAFAHPAIAQVSPEADAEVDREQTIYIPFSKLREVFEREGRGVFLPYEQFQKLWEASRSHGRESAPNEPPVDSVITEIFSEASVQNDVVQVEATLTIELLKTGWIRVPLRLEGAAILAATINNTPARITPVKDGGYQLVIENEAQQPQTIALQLRYARAFAKSPGENSVHFAAPRAPVNRWRIRVPQPGVQVHVSPMIAATEEVSEASGTGDEASLGTEDEGGDSASSPPNVSTTSDASAERPPSPKVSVEQPADGETVLLAFVGSAQQVAIRWTPKAEGATGLTALTSVQSNQEVFVSEGTMRTRTTLFYDISRAQLQKLTIEVPADHKVVNVFDPNVRKWDVQSASDDAPGVQQISVELFDPVSSKQRLMIELEKFLDSEQLDELPIAMVRAVNVGRQQGFVAVKVDLALRAESNQRTGLLQIAASELPSTFSKEDWTFAYRCASLPFALSISAEKIQPRIQVEQLVEYYVEPEQIAVDVFAQYNIEQAGVFRLEYALPPGYEVQQVRGREASGTAAFEIDSFHTAGDNDERLLVNLSRKALGKFGLWLQLRQKLADPNLLRPTGAASTIAFPIPAALGEHLTQTTGKLVAYAPESLRLTPSETTGLRAVAISEALATVPSCRDGRFPTCRPALSFAFAGPDNSMELAVERRSPYVTARQFLVVRVDSGVLKYETTIYFDIKYSSVSSLRIDVPSIMATELRNASGPIRDSLIEPAPDDVADGYVAWRMTGETEMLGTQRVRLTWEQPIGELEVGRSLDIVTPHIRPGEVDRAWGQIAVTKSESLDVQPQREPVGLRPIDPAHDLMPGVQLQDAARAFEFYDDWTLTLRATRYQLEEVKRTSIERALIRTVITRSQQRSVQALYRIRSARQRFAIQLPEDAEFDTQPARVNGKVVALERGDQDLLYVPLIGLAPDSDFLLELRYSLPGDHRQIDLPELPENPAVQKVYLAVFLPDEMTLLHTNGPWTDEFTWAVGSSFRRLPKAKRSDESLARWVAADIPAASGPAFQTDGVMYLFSALRPAPPPGGSLHLRAMHEHFFSALVIAVLVGLGIGFLRTSLPTKLAVVVLFLIGAVACGVFVPVLGQQLLNLPTYAGLAMVGLAWAGWTLARGVHRLDWFGRRSSSSAKNGPTSAQDSDAASKPDRPSPQTPPAIEETSPNDPKSSDPSSGEESPKDSSTGDSRSKEGGLDV